MGPSDGRFHTSASISQNPTFSFYNYLENNHNPVANYNQNDETNWGLFNFNNGGQIQSPNQYFMNPNQFLGSPIFSPFNSNITSTPTTGNYSDFEFKDEKTNVSDFNFQSQTRPISSSLSGNTMEESVESQVLDWNVKSQPKQFDFSMEISKTEPESLEFPQPNCNFDPIQPTKDDDRFVDGYNWRKYGQKLVKGTNKHRNYFKCSQPNCPTKKKVEKDLNGYVTEIIYKGKHNHPKPQNVKKSFVNSFQNATYDHENEPEFKSLKLNEGADEGMSYVGPKTVQEPRVVIEMKSDVDILDDGYKWRKYGQKVVKGNPNPRSYYKCTYAGCPVRKLVERAPHDPQSVVTTYEAKHNHNVPPPHGGGVYAATQPSSSTSNITNTKLYELNHGFLDRYHPNQW